MSDPLETPPNVFRQSDPLLDAMDMGATFRRHPSGIEIYMLKREPGHYFDARGREISHELAKEAGFDVERFGKDRLLRERMAVAEAEIRQQLVAEEQEKKVLVERDGLRLVAISGGRHYLEDQDGRKLTEHFLTEEQGRALIDKMAPLPVTDPGHTHAVKAEAEKVVDGLDMAAKKKAK